MGHRMEIYVSEDIAQDIVSISEKFGIEAKVIGRVEAADRSEVIIESEFGKFIYS